MRLFLQDVKIIRYKNASVYSSRSTLYAAEISRASTTDLRIDRETGIKKEAHAHWLLNNVIWQGYASYSFDFLVFCTVYNVGMWTLFPVLYWIPGTFTSFEWHLYRACSYVAFWRILQPISQKYSKIQRNLCSLSIEWASHQSSSLTLPNWRKPDDWRIVGLLQMAFSNFAFVMKIIVVWFKSNEVWF